MSWYKPHTADHRHGGVAERLKAPVLKGCDVGGAWCVVLTPWGLPNSSDPVHHGESTGSTPQPSLEPSPCKRPATTAVDHAHRHRHAVGGEHVERHHLPCRARVRD